MIVVLDDVIVEKNNFHLRHNSENSQISEVTDIVKKVTSREMTHSFEVQLFLVSFSIL